MKSADRFFVHQEDDVLLPRITFDTDLHLGYTFRRKQIPLAPAYATTFHSCQGLTLDRVGIDGSSPVFLHEQLYTAMSRIRNRQHAIFRMHGSDTNILNVTILKYLHNFYGEYINAMSLTW